MAKNRGKVGLEGSAGEYQFSSACKTQRNAGEAPARQGRGTNAGEAPARQGRGTNAGEAPALQERAAEIARMDWPQLKAGVAGCTACPLHKGRNKNVFGVGDEQAEWMFIGEGPGAGGDA